MIVPKKVPHGLAEIKAVYGNIKLGRLDGKIDIVAPMSWEDKNMIVVRDLPGFGPRPLYIHRLMEGPLRLALAQAKLKCPDYPIRKMGCFVPRMKRTNSEQYSLHSWGVAVDINSDTNRVNTTGDMPSDFVAAFVEQGFLWGGTFRTVDPMHFQLATGY